MSEKEKPAKKVEPVGGDAGVEPVVAYQDEYQAIGGSYTLDPKAGGVRKRVQGPDIEVVVEDGFEDFEGPDGQKIPKFKTVKVKELPSNKKEVK